jgi:hypothetical protein
MFRKKLRANASASKETFSASDREVFYKKVKESIDGNTLSATDIHLFTQTLLQLWPCGARHRLSSFILLNEKQLDIVGDLIPWNAYIDKENLHSFTGKQLPDTSVTRQIVQQGLGRFYGFERSVDVDALVLEGVIGYRRKDEWLYRGWIELVSPLDPTALVKSDGKFRWMRLPHGGIESIERLSDGKNFAIGTSFIATNFGASFYRKKALFLGLGLGVLQRHFEKDSLITTIEINPAIIEMFRQLYEQNTHEIIQGDFFSFLPNTERLFDTIVVDFFDENDKTLQPINFEQIIRHLEPGGNIFINSQGKSTDFENKVEEVSKAFQMEPNFHSLPHLQQLVQISFKTTK